MFDLHDCQIDASYSWRPEFGDNKPRVRIAIFPDRLTVTAFEDASEELTRGMTLFAGDPSASWRDVVTAVLDSEEYYTLNPDWPFSTTIVGPLDLIFTPDGTTALKMIALAWLGAEWTEAVRFLLSHSDDDIAHLDRTGDLLGLINRASSETTAAFVEPSGDLGADEFFHALLTALLAGEGVEPAADHLIAEHWE
ncbi:hypothetical protein [Tropicimonas sp. IMCC6043]|uniref:hypothetical protein n=1 Tax=Tropicimonas sp. IMCC6043 TaxID=2510645 RepID=UPI00101DA81F|nr:hypothetical protein [Tropicimonas sp. IMCC6043]